MKIAISTESTCDLSKELIKEYNVSIIPYTVILGDEMVEDNEDVPAKIFDFVAKTKKLPKTSAINEESYKEHFSKLLKDNDVVIHITLSGGITSSVEHAKSAANSMKNVYIVDSKSLSTGIGILAITARELANEGKEPKEIIEKLEDIIPRLNVSFVVEKLDYLYKGGRCNALALFGANLLKIRPKIELIDGLMKPTKKYRGKMSKVIKNYAKDLFEESEKFDKSIAFVTHTTSTPEMLEEAHNALKEAGFEKIYDTTAGGTITSHCGENVLGFLFINKK